MFMHHRARSLRSRRSGWRRGGCALVAVALGVLAVPQGEVRACCSANQQTIFRDHFSRSSDGAFTFVNRAGRVAGGRLVIDGDYLPTAQDRDGWAVTHAGDRRWRDYSMTARFDTSNPGGSPSEVHMASFYVRVRDAADTFYKVMVFDPGQPDPRGSGDVIDHGLVQVFRVVDGDHTLLKEVERSYTTTGDNRVRITAVGATLTVTINGRWILKTTDPSPIRSGGVGVGQIWETNGSFDDVVVKAVCSR